MSEDWEEHTEIVPRVVRARRNTATFFLSIAMVMFGVAVATLFVPQQHRVEQATKDAITADAQKLGVVLHATLTQTLDRAEGFAGAPMLEAGILTDAATVADVVKTEIRLKTRPGETLELFQVRGDEIAPLVRVPPGAQPVAFAKDRKARLENRNGLAVAVSAEVAPYNNTPELAGQLAVAVKVDTSQLQLAKTTVEANLVGGSPPIPLVAKRGNGGPPITIPIPLDAKWQLGDIALHAVPVVTAYYADWLLPVRYGAAGLGVMLLCTFLVALRRALRA